MNHFDPSFLDEFKQYCLTEMLSQCQLSLQEYQESCREFLLQQQSLSQQAKELWKRRKELKQSIANLQKTVRYGKGGKMLHRGPLCPDFTEDLVVGNLRRGRLCKTKPLSPDYVYHLDANDNLLMVQSDHAVEYIVSQDHTTMGIAFYKSFPQTLCLCQYNQKGQLEKYTLALLNDQAEVQEYTQCRYTYAPDELLVDKLQYLHDSWGKNLPLVSKDRFQFTVENGYLTRYVVTHTDQKDATHLAPNQRAYSIKIKRKVDPPNE